MSNELKPCPSCGNTEPFKKEEQLNDELFMCELYCVEDSPAVEFSSQGIGETPEEAYAMAKEFWNERYEPTCTWSPMVRDPENPKESHWDWEGNWNTECGEAYIWEDGKPSFCPNCGAKVVSE